METNQLKSRTVTILNPMCQVCEKRYTCNNKTFMNCYVPDNKTTAQNIGAIMAQSVQESLLKMEGSMSSESIIKAISNLSNGGGKRF